MVDIAPEIGRLLPMDPLTYTELWQGLAPDVRARACVAFWRADDELSQLARPTVLSALAKAMNFREKFMKMQTDAKKGDLLMRRASLPDFRRFHGDLLRVLLLTEHSKVIEQFLDVQGIPRQGCFLEGDEPPSVKSLRKGIKAIRAAWGDWSTCFYLGFLLAQGEADYWAALPDAIAAEGLDIRGTVLGA
jgi:hypothetical protein